MCGAGKGVANGEVLAAVGGGALSCRVLSRPRACTSSCRSRAPTSTRLHATDALCGMCRGGVERWGGWPWWWWPWL